MDEYVLLKGVIDNTPTDIELQFQRQLPLFIIFVFGDNRIWEVPKTLLLEGLNNGKAGLLDVKVDSDLITTKITFYNGVEAETLNLSSAKLRKFVERAYKISGDEADVELWIARLLDVNWTPLLRETSEGTDII